MDEMTPLWAGYLSVKAIHGFRILLGFWYHMCRIRFVRENACDSVLSSRRGVHEVAVLLRIGSPRTIKRLIISPSRFIFQLRTVDTVFSRLYSNF